MTSETERKLREFIVDTFLFGEGGDDLGSEESLLAQGIIDSTGVLEVTTFLEESLGLHVEDNELIPDNFDSITKLVAFVTRKRSGAGSKAGSKDRSKTEERSRTRRVATTTQQADAEAGA
jgi:acyl carrier protein